MTSYRGIVIAESLTDWSWINQVRVVDAEICENQNDLSSLWHIYTVEATGAQLAKLEYLLKPRGFYTHFSNGEEGLVIFPRKTFAVDPRNQSTWQAAIQYGIQSGIPVAQMDFFF